MKRIITLLILIVLLAIPLTHAQYDLSFKGIGQSSTVERVTVENLTQGTFMELSGSDILRLTESPTSIEEVLYNPDRITTKIYPNPAIGESTLSFSLPDADDVELAIIDFSGRVVTKNIFSLESGEHIFTLPSLNAGIYAVSLIGNKFSTSSKWISLGNGSGRNITYISGTTWGGEGTKNAASILPSPLLKASSVKVDEANASASIKEMKYGNGDLLRITGKSGNYTTIIMKCPTISQEVEFNFIKCTDGAGNHYPIIKIGSYYWMAENLKGTKVGVSKKTSANAWKDGGNDSPMMAYYNFDDANKGMGGFYSYQGALLAMPEGWRLPSSGEVDATLKALGGYDPSGELLKGKGSDFYWSKPSTGIDEISFGAKAIGNLNPENGSFRAFGASAGFWTREKKSESAYYWEILNNDARVALEPGKLITQKAGLQVRGIVDAPSVYEKIIENAFNPMLKSMSPSAKTGEDAPLGKKFIITDGTKKMFVAAATENSQDHMLARIDQTDWSKTTMVTADGANSDWNLRLKKSVAQTNAEGRQNLVVAEWKQTGYTGTSTQRLHPYGSGIITLHIFADEPGGYAEIKTVEIPDFIIPEIADYLFSDMGIPFSSDSRRFEASYGYSWTIQVNAGDINGDGVDDIFVSVDRKLVVLDGKTYSKIAERDFSGEFTPNNATRLFYLRTEIGDVDHDGKNDVVVAISHPVANTVPKLHVFLGGNISSEDGHFVQDILIDNQQTVRTANIAVGDVDGDNIDDLVVFVKQSGGALSRLAVMKYKTANPNNRKFEVAGAAVGLQRIIRFNAAMESVKLARLRGGGIPSEIIVENEILRFDGSTLTFPYGMSAFGSAYNDSPSNELTHSVYNDQIVVGNFDNNELGKEQILHLEKMQVGNSATGKIITSVEPRYTWLNSSNKIARTQLVPIMGATGSSGSATSPYPMLGAAASNSQAKVLEYKSHAFTLSEPRIHALMAAPPYYADYDYRWDMGTSWGKSSMQGSGTENSNTVSGSLILGFEMEFNAPIIGTKIGGVDFTTKLKMGSTWAESKETTLTKSNTFTLWYDDAVVLTAIPYETYTYTIVKSDNEEQVGADMIIGFPGNALTAMITLDDYDEMTANDPSVPNLRSIFKHTAGIPTSYPSDKNQIKSNAAKPFVHFGGAVEGSEFTGIGSGGNLARSISVDTEMANSEAFNFDFEAELVVTAFGVKAGAGFGYGNSNTSTSKIGTGHTISGIVAGLDKFGERPNFNWNVAWFNYTKNGQTFPVVYYVVKQ